jgi:hypothetical protein
MGGKGGKSFNCGCVHELVDYITWSLDGTQAILARVVCQPMNNSNTSAILRSLIVYAICVPLAIFVGYSLSNPLESNNLKFYGVLVAVLLSPIFLRWHLELLVFSWSATITIFLLPGTPNFWVLITCISLTISILERILNSDRQFIRVPRITWPLLAFLAVVIFTAELTGGMGMKALGSSVYGGKKYFFLFLSIASYFALTARPIPPKKAALFVTLFFAGNFTALIGYLYPYSPTWMNPLFLVFPPSLEGVSGIQGGEAHAPALAAAGMAIYCLMMAKFGPRDIFLSGKPWRLALLILGVILLAMGGFRSSVLLAMATFTIMFFWEGLHRTALMLVLVLVGLMVGIALIPLAPKLPWSMQRALAFIPGLDLDPDARNSAEDSTEWRINMWTALLPQIPPHLLLGKGLAISPEEYDEMMAGNEQMEYEDGKLDASQNGLALAADYHNGMLSLIIPFGVWGVVTVLWFLGAGIWVLYRNAKYGPEDLRRPNAFLFALFFFEAAAFVSCFGGLQISSELASFVGYLGLSIALNNGVCQPEPQESVPFRSVLPFRTMPRPLPAFQR